MWMKQRVEGHLWRSLFKQPSLFRDTVFGHAFMDEKLPSVAYSIPFLYHSDSLMTCLPELTTYLLPSHRLSGCH